MNYDELEDRYWIDTASEEAIAGLMMDLSTGVGIDPALRADFSRIARTLGVFTKPPDGPRWPIMIVDEKAGGVIAYAVSVEHASRIAQALDAFGDEEGDTRKDHRMRINEGTIVVPTTAKDRTVGIVTDGGFDVVTVVWLSEQHGALCSIESVDDIHVADVEEDHADNVSRSDIAVLLGRL